VSELIAAPAGPQDVVEDPEHAIEVVSQPLVVITEQEAVTGFLTPFTLVLPAFAAPGEATTNETSIGGGFGV